MLNGARDVHRPAPHRSKRTRCGRCRDAPRTALLSLLIDRLDSDTVPRSGARIIARHECGLVNADIAANSGRSWLRRFPSAHRVAYPPNIPLGHRISHTLETAVRSSGCGPWRASKFTGIFVQHFLGRLGRGIRGQCRPASVDGQLTGARPGCLNRAREGASKLRGVTRSTRARAYEHRETRT